MVLPTPLEVPATTIVGTFGGMPATGRKSYDEQLELYTGEGEFSFYKNEN